MTAVKATDQAPVVTIDGPSGTGKSTICQKLATMLGWHYLDSGALYRALAWGLIHHDVDGDDRVEVIKVLPTLKITLEPGQSPRDAHVFCNSIDITGEIRTEKVSMMASKIGAIPEVRQRLMQLQREQRRQPGLITDGRDMGTVIFPDAPYKFFMQASAEERAKRRYNQLKDQGIDGNLRSILEDQKERDARDAARDICPLKPAEDAILIDTTTLSIDQVLETVLAQIKCANSKL